MSLQYEPSSEPLHISAHAPRAPTSCTLFPRGLSPRAWQCAHSATDALLRRNMKRFRGGLVFKAHRLLYHSILGLRVIKKKKKKMHAEACCPRGSVQSCPRGRWQVARGCLDRCTRLVARDWWQETDGTRLMAETDGQHCWHETDGKRLTPRDAYQETDGKRFRGGLVSKAHRLVHHSSIGLIVVKKKRED